MSPKAQPLRTALIGLSSSAATSWAAAAHLPSLLTPTGKSKISITALLNSSEEAARSAIKTYDLPSTTKAYGTPDALAADPDIDLVICNTRVDKHYETILPSIQAGKDIYVEWPIAANHRQIDELVATAKKSGSRVAVGLQRRFAPPVLKIKEIVGSGRLGKVLSSDLRAFGGTNDREILPPSLKYFADREIGGNPITIGFGHVFDFTLSILGDLVPETVHSKLQLQRPNVRIRDPATGEVVDKTVSDVPDLLSVHGTISKSSYTDPSATLSVLFRRGQPFPGTPALSLTINCELGEIRLLSPSSLALEFSPEDNPAKIQIHHFASDQVEEVAWDWSDLQKEVSARGRIVQSCLYAFADGVREVEGWVGLEDAATRAAQIDGFFEGWLRTQK